MAFYCMCYVIGSIPMGWMVTKVVSWQDLRRLGSGNVGATNVMRNLGKGWGILTFILDACKGIAVIYISTQGGWAAHAYGGLCVAMMGHGWPVWLKFQGGKGVSVFLGGLLCLTPGMGLFCIALWAGISYGTGYGSIASFLSCGVGLYYGNVPPHMVWIMAAFLIWKHRSNILRLYQGKENRL